MAQQQTYTLDNWPVDRWPNFGFGEIACRHTGDCAIDPDFMDSVQKLRVLVNAPLTVTSFYRSPNHPVEASKEKKGAHTYGRAVDIQCSGATAHAVLRAACELGFTGIGIAQTGDHSGRFIHLDGMSADDGFPRPALWSY